MDPNRPILIFYKSLLAEFSLGESLLICQLIDQRNLLLQRGITKTKRDWFVCSEKFISDHLSISLQTQRRQFLSLRTKGIIKTKSDVRRHPSRLVRVNVGKLRKFMPIKNDSLRHSCLSIIIPEETSETRSSLVRKIKPRVKKKLGGRYASIYSKEENKNINNILKLGFLPTDVRLAKVLRSCLNKKRKLIGKRPRIQNWANEFRLLRKDVEASIIKKVLAWYCNHLDDMYVPVAYSARSFRSKFVRIKDARTRNLGLAFVRPRKKIRLTPEAKSLSESLLGEMTWPKNSSAYIPTMVQTAMIEYKWFRSRLYKLHKKNKMARLMWECLPKNYIERWFARVNKQIANWDAWTGNMSMFDFKITHSTFVSFCLGELKREGRRDPAKDWEALLELIDYES